MNETIDTSDSGRDAVGEPPASQAAIEQVLADINAIGRDLAGMLYMIQLKFLLTDPEVWAGMIARRRRAEARVADDSFKVGAASLVSEAAKRRVELVYPDWPDAAGQIALANGVAVPDAPSVVADVATDAAYVALGGGSSQDNYFLAMTWNKFVATDHPVTAPREPRKPRTGLLAKLFGAG